MSTGFRFPEPDALLDALVQLAAFDSELKERSGHLFASLKALNRTATSQVRASKQQTAQARMAMDEAHLQLQNLLYERRHLEREIEKCNRFASVALSPLRKPRFNVPYQLNLSRRAYTCVRRVQSTCSRRI